MGRIVKKYLLKINDQEARVLIVALSFAERFWCTGWEKEEADEIRKKLFRFRIEMREVQDDQAGKDPIGEKG